MSIGEFLFFCALLIAFLATVAPLRLERWGDE